MAKCKYVQSDQLARQVVVALRNVDNNQLKRGDVRYLGAMLKRYKKGLNYTELMRDEIQRIAKGDEKRKGNWAITPDKFLPETELKSLFVKLKEQYDHLQNANSFMDYFLIKMLFVTGFRNSELCEMRVNQTPYVLMPGDTPEVWIRGKGNKLRTVVIPADLVELIKYYVENIRPQFLPANVSADNYNKPLIYNIYRKPYSRFGLWNRVKTIGKKAGLNTKLYPHKLRHSLATTLYRSTRDLQLVQSQLGHSNINTTTIYAALDRESISAKIENINILHETVRVENSGD